MYREIEHIKEKHKRQSRDLYLLVEMPQIQVHDIPHLVVYFEKSADEIHHFAPAPETIKLYDAEVCDRMQVYTFFEQIIR